MRAVQEWCAVCECDHADVDYCAEMRDSGHPDYQPVAELIDGHDRRCGRCGARANALLSLRLSSKGLLCASCERAC